ncbi:MAG: hypothetical protein SFZ23_13260 [Planctomycetota bacterium]|nr:hypothetical protein [Planctomycetota bacterium]
MTASYNNRLLFSSGPHRFWIGRQGQTQVSKLSQAVLEPGVFVIGLEWLRVLVVGRLVATSESALWTLRSAMVAELVNPPIRAPLVDRWGRTFADMSFVTYTESPRVDRGRSWSIGYTAEFKRIADL